MKFTMRLISPTLFSILFVAVPSHADFWSQPDPVTTYWQSTPANLDYSDAPAGATYSGYKIGQAYDAKGDPVGAVDQINQLSRSENQNGLIAEKCDRHMLDQETLTSLENALTARSRAGDKLDGSAHASINNCGASSNLESTSQDYMQKNSAALDALTGASEKVNNEIKTLSSRGLPSLQGGYQACLKSMSSVKGEVTLLNRNNDKLASRAFSVCHLEARSSAPDQSASTAVQPGIPSVAH